MTARTSSTAVVTAVAVATVAACAALYASPYWALRTLSTAVQNQDAATVAEHVDFPALREDLKGQLLLKVQREMAKPGVESQPFSGLGQMFAMGLVNQMVDGLVSPTGVALALKNGAVLRSISSGIPGVSSETPQGAESGHEKTQPKPQPKNPQRGDFTLRYENWSTVQVQPKDGTSSGFTLRRDGLLSWKLVAMDLSALQR